MSIFRKATSDEGPTRRVRVRHLVPFALLVLVSVLLVPAGGAKPPPVTSFEICVQNATGGTPAPACSATGTSSDFAGNTTATVKVTVTNDRASTSSIGSANIAVPPELKVIAGSGSANVVIDGQTIKFRNLSLNKGQSVVATFNVGVACGGTGDWANETQQAFTSTNATGTSFGLLTGSSTGLSSGIDTACHLAFVQQPTDTTSGDTIVNRLLQPDQSVTVGLFNNEGDPLGACPAGYESGCSVDVASTPSGVTGTTTRPLVGGDLASFADLSITNTSLATQYNLTAVGHGGFAPLTTPGSAPGATSSSFLIAKIVNPLQCPGNSCTTGSGHQPVSGGGDLADSFVDVSSSNGFTFMTVSPYTLDGEHARAGCQGLAPLLVTGFAESDGRLAGSGTLTIKYYVNKDILSARYGVNYGNQFAPMCVGARPVDTVSGAIHDCNEQGPWNTGGWTGKAITSDGKFRKGTATAVCDSDGYYWGIISSYQDKLDATANPTVTNWGGQNINGDNYRFFEMSIPPGWDWRSGP